MPHYLTRIHTVSSISSAVEPGRTDELLVKLNHERHKTLRYVDDPVILTQEKFNNVVWSKVQNPLQVQK